jgi:3-oxoacyl-(acyl-carrier-protein) synthase
MRIAVTGMGIVCAAGAGVDAFTRALEEGRTGDRPAEHLLAPEHQARIGATIPVPELGEAKGPRDRAFPLAERALDEALERAGLADGSLPEDTALLVGTSLGGVPTPSPTTWPGATT